jgi:hypothetical protein
MTSNVEPVKTVRSSSAAARLQTASSIAVILASLCVMWMAWQRVREPPDPVETYAVGEQMDPVEGVDFSVAQYTLVMAFRENCSFCQESVPFYQKLSAAMVGAPGRPHQLAVVSTDSVVALSAHLTANAMHVDHVINIQPGELKIPGTPLLFLVDRSGTVKRVWRGRLETSEEEEVFGALGLTVMN